MHCAVGAGDARNTCGTLATFSGASEPTSSGKTQKRVAVEKILAVLVVAIDFLLIQRDLLVAVASQLPPTPSQRTARSSLVTSRKYLLPTRHHDVTLAHATTDTDDL